MNATVTMKREARKDSLVHDIALDKIHKSSTSLPLFAVWDNNLCFGNRGRPIDLQLSACGDRDGKPRPGISPNDLSFPGSSDEPLVPRIGIKRSKEGPLIEALESCPSL